MKDIYKDEEIIVPADVTLEIKSRVIKVEGPRGKLTKVGSKRLERRGTIMALSCSTFAEIMYRAWLFFLYAGCQAHQHGHPTCQT